MRNPAAPAPRLRILVVDDERGPRESLRILLKPDYDVAYADSVDAALASVQDCAPDLVIQDIRMPGTDGIEGLRRLRELDPDLCIVMLTGFGDLETARKAIRHGATDYLKKPFDTRELLDVVRANCERTRQNRVRRQLERQLQEMASDLRGQAARRNHLAVLGLASSELVHDIRNPLAIMYGYLDLLHVEMQAAGEVGGLSSDAQSYIENIRQSLRRCTDLTETWRNLGRTERLNFEPVTVGDLLAEVVLEAHSPKAPVLPQLDLDPATAGRIVHVDRIQIKRALQNLLQNALQAVLPGEGEVRIRVQPGEGGDTEIQIVDNGYGIAPETLNRLFEPFFTTKDRNHGTGLGLFIAKQVVEDHGGTIQIESEPDRGTRVRLTLPRTPPTPPPEPS